MPGPWSAKDAANDIRSLAKEANRFHDATKGCSAAESILVKELQNLEKDPKRLTAVRAELNLNSWNWHQLPRVEIYDKANHELGLNITGNYIVAQGIESTGRVFYSEPNMAKPEAMLYALQNFEALDKNKDGTLTAEELSRSSIKSVRELPVSSPDRQTTTTGVAYGFSTLNYGSLYQPSLGYHLESRTETTPGTNGITKADLAAMYNSNKDIYCRIERR